MNIALTTEQRASMEQITEDVDVHLQKYVMDYVNHIVKQQDGATKLAKMNRLNVECLDTDIDEMITVLDIRIAEAEAEAEKEMGL